MWPSNAFFERRPSTWHPFKVSWILCTSSRYDSPSRCLRFSYKFWVLQSCWLEPIQLFPPNLALKSMWPSNAFFERRPSTWHPFKVSWILCTSYRYDSPSRCWRFSYKFWVLQSCWLEPIQLFPPNLAFTSLDLVCFPDPHLLVHWCIQNLWCIIGI